MPRTIYGEKLATHGYFVSIRKCFISMGILILNIRFNPWHSCTYRLCTIAEKLRVRNRIRDVRTYDVRSHSLGRFVGHLHTILEYRHREMGGRVGRQPQTEVRVGCVRVKLLANFLQSSHPGNGQMAILKDHPGTFLLGRFDHLEGYWSLALPEG